MKKILFTFLLSFSLVLFLGLGKAYAQEAPPVYESIGEGCGEFMAPQLIDTIQIFSTKPEATEFTLPSIGKYLFEVSGQYVYGAPRIADAAYANDGSWLNPPVSTLGIYETATYRGVTSLLSDM